MRLIFPVVLILTVPFPLVATETDFETLRRRAIAVLAPIAGELKAPGIKEPVEIVRDRWGVPHIYAKNQHDLFFAQGFVAAQDRLFQLELWRRHAAGEMAELLGKEGIESDRFARLIRYRGDMEKEWQSYSPDTKEIATAFTHGINACIDQFGDNLPIEFELLKFRPKKWQPEDVLGRVSGIYMSQNFRNEIARARLVAAVGIEKARKLAPVDPPRDYSTSLPLDTMDEIGKVLDGYQAAAKLLDFRPARTESNNWVISGKLSASGKPMLASDPHRALAAPSLRYLVHLHAPGWNVIGAGEPALPGVGLGHNERIAWGITIVGIDQADIFVEETHPEDPSLYKVEDRWARMEEVIETIRVKGQEDTVMSHLRYTRHGPVIYQDAKRNRAYTLKWVGSEPGGAAYLGGLAVARAKDRASFLKALQSWKIPNLNFVYADVEGHIGWIAHAGTPIRDGHDGLLPVPGAKTKGWLGQLPIEEEPQSWNPDTGWLATANHKILPKSYRHPIGFEFAPPYRYERLEHALKSKKTWKLEDFAALQHDDVSIPARRLIALLREDPFTEDDLKPVAERLTKWDGKLAVESTAGSLFSLWLRELQKEFFGKHVPDSLRADLISLSGLPVMLPALETADPFWLGKDGKAARRELFRTTLRRAAKELAKLPDEKQNRWGALHVAEFRHPLTKLGGASEKLFRLPPLERGGDANTPLNTRYDETFRQVHGATYRHLFDLVDWDRGLATSAPGQSGQPGSPHYGDLLPLWGRGEYFPLVYSRRKVDEMGQNRLWLRP